MNEPAQSLSDVLAAAVADPAPVKQPAKRPRVLAVATIASRNAVCAVKTSYVE